MLNLVSTSGRKNKTISSACKGSGHNTTAGEQAAGLQGDARTCDIVAARQQAECARLLRDLLAQGCKGLQLGEGLAHQEENLFGCDARLAAGLHRGPSECLGQSSTAA